VTGPRRTIGEMLETVRASLDRLDPAEAAEAAARGALLVDTRSGEALASDGSIPGAIHVPLSVLFWRMDDTSGYSDPRLTDRERLVILVCAHGYSSSLAAATLHELGFARATDIVGGFEAWAEQGLPVIASARSTSAGGD
jgi:rhodanese-related sulfurtransferase